MESFENFNDTTSQYGPADDTAFMISGYTTTSTVKTQEGSTPDLTSISLPDNARPKDADAKFAVVDEDFDGVLEDLKDNNSVDLPTHACRYDFPTVPFPSETNLV
jgi:hypothetical protein